MVLILGSNGMLGSALLKVFGSDAVGWGHADIDITDFSNLKSKILNLKSLPEAIINCVAFNDVDGAETSSQGAVKLNAEVPGQLAKICKELAVTLVHFSTNYVFNGEKGEYKEDDAPAPLSAYARTKHQGELEVQKNTDKFYIIRTSVLFGPKGVSQSSKKSFLDLMLALAEKQKEIKVVSDEINSITYAVDLAWAVKVLLSQKFPFGIYHFANLGQASWYDFAKEIFRIKGLDVKVVPVPSSGFPREAKRPKKAVLINTKFIQFRPWQEALSEFLNL